jgi:microcompartment protein CcmL/EutN
MARQRTTTSTTRQDAPIDPLSPSVAGLELADIPAGFVALDAMAKDASVRVAFASEVEPSRFLVLVDGPLGDVEAALDAGIRAAGADALESLLLPAAEDALRDALQGTCAATPTDPDGPIDALLILQADAILATLAAVDRALKTAPLGLLRLRLATHLHGQGHALFAGALADVQAGAEAAARTDPGTPAVRTRIVARPHPVTWRAAQGGGAMADAPSLLDAF